MKIHIQIDLFFFSLTVENIGLGFYFGKITTNQKRLKDVFKGSGSIEN